MTKVVFASLLVISSYFGFSQNTTDASVKKSVFGVQVGLIGVWAHNELKLSNQFALRSEVGISGVNTGNISPSISLEPRWYYNLNKRLDNGKRIDGNSGNYISFRSNYYFRDALEIEDNDLYKLLIVPTWGIRRNIGNHFNYEAGAGAGIGYENAIKLAIYVNLRIGYRF